MQFHRHILPNVRFSYFILISFLQPNRTLIWELVTSGGRLFVLLSQTLAVSAGTGMQSFVC